MIPSLIHALEDWAEHAPSRPLLIGQKTLTYAEVSKIVRGRSEHIDPTRPLLLARPNDDAWVIEMLAAIRARAPLVLLPPSWTVKEKQPIEEWMKRVCDDGSWLTSGAALALATSGTTGRPRLALRSCGSLTAEAERYRLLWQLRTDDVIVAALPLCHAYALGATLVAGIVAGASLVVDNLTTPRAIARAIQKHRATILPLVVPLARALAQLDRGQQVDTSLRVAMVGAGQVIEEIATPFLRKWAVSLSQNYGSSETGATLACYAPHAQKCTGVPLIDVECHLGEGNGNLGQLWVRSSHPPLGYVDAGGVTSANLSPGGWWPTGDVFFRDADGFYIFQHRLDDRVRRGGRTIDPREVEQAIASHPAVADVQVRAGRKAGHDDTVQAYVALRHRFTASISELCEHAKGRIASYKVPTEWYLQNTMPRNWSGKLLVHSTEVSKVQEDARLFSALLTGRLSQAVLAANHVGLWGELAAGPCTIGELSAKLHLDHDALELFARCLIDTSLVRWHNGTLVLVGRPPDPAVCALERYLAQTWLRVDAIVSVLRNGVERREFERAQDEELVQLYTGALCGSQTLALVRLAVAMAGVTTEPVLEIGRGLGLLGMALARRVTSIALTPAPAIAWGDYAESPTIHSWEDISPDFGCYRLILVINGVHWLPARKRTSILSRLLNGLCPGGTVAFLDIFLSEKSNEASIPTSLLILDWLTHGGTFNLTAQELTEALEKVGIENIHHRSSKGLFSLVYGSKPQQQEETNERRYQATTQTGSGRFTQTQPKS